MPRYHVEGTYPEGIVIPIEKTNQVLTILEEMTMNNSRRRNDFHRPGKLMLNIVLVAFTILSLVQVDVSRAAQGDLDPTYGIDGKVEMFPGDGIDPYIGTHLSYGDGDYVYCENSVINAEDVSSAIQADDKIVVVGTRWAYYYGGDYCSRGGGDYKLLVSRLNQDGYLDTGFGSNGMVITEVDGSHFIGVSVAIQSDGKIVVVGNFHDNGDNSAIVRYNSDGSLDTSFGTDGMTIVSETNAVSIDIQSDGKIVVGGAASLTRLNSDGSLDTSFDDDGRLLIGFSGGAGFFSAMVIQPDNKIVMVGEIEDDFALTRYNIDGSPDTSFDSDGLLTTDFDGRSDHAYAATIQSDGKILVVGSSANDFAMARYNPNGSLDTSFDDEGLVTTDFSDGSESILSHEKAVTVDILPEGKIIVSGTRRTWYHAGGISPFELLDEDFGLVLYSNNGELDSSFGSGGLVTTSFVSIGDEVHSAALQSDGKYVVMGYSCLRILGAAAPDSGWPCGHTAARYLVVGNHSPEMEINSSNVSANEGQIAANSGTVNDPDGDTLTLTSSVGSVTENNDGTWSWSYTPEDGPSESQMVTITAEDGNGGSAETTFELSVNNEAPTATFTHDGQVEEGSTFTLSLLSPFDPSSADTTAGFEYAFDCGDGSGYNANSASNSVACLTSDDGVRAVKAQIRDKDGGVSEYTANVSVENVAPTIIAINGPPDPVQVGTAINFTAEFTDPSELDSHSLNWDWGDGNNDNIDPATSPASITHVYSQPGVYTVEVTVCDDDGGTTTDKYEYVVVYNSEGVFVTGGGWIDSPEGSYTSDPTLTGKATFGFVSKYKQGASVPTGNTKFMLKVADLSFQSAAYEWLVVTGNNDVRFKGEGTISGSFAPNGEAYKFMLWASDRETDTFRIRIWYEGNGVEYPVYDNGMEQAIGGGSIVIHK